MDQSKIAKCNSVVYSSTTLRYHHQPLQFDIAYIVCCIEPAGHCIAGLNFKYIRSSPTDGIRYYFESTCFLERKRVYRVDHESIDIYSTRLEDM